MRNIMMAAVAAVTLSITSGSLTGKKGTDHHNGVPKKIETTLPGQRSENLASVGAHGGSDVLPGQRPAYLASIGAQGNNNVLPSQRPAYLA